MARNEEKAQSLFNKWTTMKETMLTGPKQRRPFLASECDNLQEAEKWRREIIKEITKKVAEIQNAGLGEHRIRDLNDQINKLLREKGHWQRRIIELGGANYFTTEPKTYDADGHELPGSGGYKYFGAAKNLPGVRELFQAKPPEPPRRSRADMYKGIDPDYYGYRDDDDGVLIDKEAEMEQKRIECAVNDWREKKKQKLLSGEDDIVDETSNEELEEFDINGPISAITSAALKAHVLVPSQDDIEALILERKKQSLLKKIL